jgi:hypothetical protein
MVFWNTAPGSLVKVDRRLKADSHLTTRHRHDPTTTGRENIITVTLNGPVHIQRQRHDTTETRHRHDSDNRQTLKES